MRELRAFREMSCKNRIFEGFCDKFEKHLSHFKAYLIKQADNFEPELREAVADCVKPQGKYLRPLLLFASAKSASYSDKTLQNRAAIVELIHLASLIHDDVIDNASMRRNSETAYKKFGTRTAILLGDAVFAHAMQLAFKERDERVWHMSVDAVKTLCEGEIRQSLAVEHEVSMQRYLSIIEGKTATLFELACFMGASLSDTEDCEWSKAAKLAGKHLGRAYQMYDDVCDWVLTEKDSGKTVGTDLLSEKQTLPVIILLSKLPKSKSCKISENMSAFSAGEIRDLMKANAVLKECGDIFDEELKKAKKAMRKFTGKNEALLEFCDAVNSMMPRVWND